MVFNYTNYSINGIVQKISKGRLVQQIVENYIRKSKMSFCVLQDVWYNELQGDRGVMKKVTDINKSNEQYYYINAPITLCDGTVIAICNQWSKENLSNLILHAELLGLKIKDKRTYFENH